MDDFELGCGPGSMGCWYCTKHCPNCNRVVFDQDIIYGDLRKYCRYCRVEVEEEERQILEDDLDDDEDDIEDEYEEDDDSLFGKSQVLELSQEDIDDEYEEDDIISILKSIVKIAFYLALLMGVLIAVIAIMMRRK